MSDFVGHLVRRGVQHANDIVVNGGDKVKMPEPPAWGITLVSGTLIAFVVFLSALSYTLSDVVGSLTMIETPTHAIALSSSEEEAEKKDSLLEEPEMVTVKPITARIRTTIRHITAIGGRWARWRAIVPAVFYSVLLSFTLGLFDAILPSVPGRDILSHSLAVIALAPVHMAWTHALISMPSSLRWHQRIAPISSMKKLWIPAAINTVATFAVIYLTFGFTMLLGACTSSIMAKKEAVPQAIMFGVFALKGLAVVAFACAMCLFVVLPAAVTLARVEASMLPEDQETIVPFDRSFGGKVVPEGLGGSGAIGFVDAWRTFDWEARRRLVKLYIKNFLIFTAVSITMAHLLAFETWAIMGPELGTFLSSLKQNLEL